MEFKKYVVSGNDFIILSYEDVQGCDLKDLSKKVCNRHYGLGGDGVLIYKASEEYSGEMIYYDKDGMNDDFLETSLVAFTKYLYDESIIGEGKVIIEIGGNLRELELISGEKGSSVVKVLDPILEAKEIPINMDMDMVIGESIEIAGYDYLFSSVNIGKAESTIFVQKINDAQINYLGEKLSNHEYFPQKTNANFVVIVDRAEINIFSWDKNKGRVIGSPSGACAAVVIGNLMGSLDNKVRVNMEAGKLNIEYIDGKVFLSGEAEFIARGEYNKK